MPTSVLQRVADLSERELKNSLHGLQKNGFVSANGFGPSLSYTFNHSMLQEVAYQFPPPQRRVHLHAVAATAFEEIYAGRLGEYASLIAYHWESANDKFKAERWRRRAIRGVKQIRVRREPRTTKRR